MEQTLRLTVSIRDHRNRVRAQRLEEEIHINEAGDRAKELAEEIVEGNFRPCGRRTRQRKNGESDAKPLP